MSLATNITDAFTRVSTEAKALRTLINGNTANLSALNTSAKTSLVDAINEVVAAVGGAGATIDDGTTSAVSVWSSQKTDAEIDAAVAALVSSAPGALDTLNELAAALGGDANFATTITNALALKAPLASPTFTGTVTVADGVFTIGKTSGLQAALDGKIPGIVDPHADRIIFWDDSAGSYAALSLSGLTISGTTMSPTAASETATGVAELATLAEVSTGTDTTRYVSAAGVRQEILTRAATTHTHAIGDTTGLQAALDGKSATCHTHTAADISGGTLAAARLPTATDAAPGIIELATDAETATGSDTARAVTPAGLRHVLGPPTDFIAAFEAGLA